MLSSGAIVKVSFQSIYVICGPLWAADTSVSIDVLAHFGIACTAAARCTKAQEFLSSRGAINFTNVNISVGIDRYHVRPMELACLASATSKATQFCQILPVNDIDHVIEQIGDVHAGLFRVSREVNRTGCAADGLRSNVDLSYKTTLAHLSVKICAGLPNFGCLEDLHTIVAAIANI